ncbi:MAG: ribosomal protein S18-alanine N-acetyltransferase [Pseudomonadota bacterium]
MNRADWVLRAARPGDLDALCALETAASAAPWNRARVRDSLDRHRIVVALAPHGARIIGCAALRQVLDEAELLNVLVAPEYRRRGLGRALVEAGAAAVAGARWLHLEVRAGNAAARALYGGLGFERVGIRRGYYPAADGGREDAVLMRLELGRAGPRPPE